jgi:hypothetical protein
MLAAIAVVFTLCWAALVCTADLRPGVAVVKVNREDEACI